ncbi:uncharacterized protein TNCV_3157541 [Trichonephila clavipes]|nr:uncharacterized protein TNCV_3157541 [Trichonephila clavipes]
MYNVGLYASKSQIEIHRSIWLERTFQKHLNGNNKTPSGSIKECRERLRMNDVERINYDVGTPVTGAIVVMQWNDEMAFILTSNGECIDCVRSFMKTHWAATSARFSLTFVNNPFRHKSNVCNRLWFLRSLKQTKEKHL